MVAGHTNQKRQHLFLPQVETIRRVKGFNDETKRFPQTQFMTMALFDVISGVMTLFGGVYTKGTTQVRFSFLSFPSRCTVITIDSAFHFTSPKLLLVHF